MEYGYTVVGSNFYHDIYLIDRQTKRPDLLLSIIISGNCHIKAILVNIYDY